ncbi:histidine phosphatase family protein [Fulvivirga sp. M361]|uniref:histidine phosphatase family protein n=1 Tax=Fulvivirga sp. M361 TaxID=2594266 RepID=UPI00162962DA|nr:histidine phosphatase family protein [Fulvivirga sp. M361]
MIRKSTELFLLASLLLPGFIPKALAQTEHIAQYYNRLQKESKREPQTIRFVEGSVGLVDDHTKLSQILLLRHGEPALDKKGRRRQEAIKYIHDYDSVGVYSPGYIPVKLLSDELQVIHTSTIARSISTARLVFNQEDIQRPDALFREFERKIFSFPNIKLPLSWWLTGSRLLWFMGFNKKGIESFSQAKARAKSAALFLEKDALENGKTLLVSHGLLNHYLVKYLKKNGWEEVYDGGKGYLSQKLLIRYED